MMLLPAESRAARVSAQVARRALRDACLLACTAALLSAGAEAQRGGRFPRGEVLGGMSGLLGGPGDFYTPPAWRGNPVYEGRFTFARLKYRGYGYWAGPQGPGWSHDYPDADVHFMKIVREITSMRPFVNIGDMMGGVIVAMDDPELYKYPIAYLSEPGGWYPNEQEIKGLGNYLKKGGFMLIDDFPPEAWGLWEQNMSKVWPELKPIQLKGTEQVFDSFFKVDIAKINRGFSGGNRGAGSAFYGYFENNDPTKRLIVLAGYNHDLGEAWEWSGQGFMAVDITNEAFKLGVNIVVYALTH
jgi:hypothetical protein